MNPPPGQIPLPQLLVLFVIGVLLFGLSGLRPK